jgi:hypothetical protein
MKSLNRTSLIFLFLAQLSSSGFAQSRIITTYVGPGLPVMDALATSQPIDRPTSVAPDGAGGFYVAIGLQNRVYRVTAEGRLNLVAGNGTNGYSGGGDPATAATISRLLDGTSCARGGRRPSISGIAGA